MPILGFCSGQFQHEVNILLMGTPDSHSDRELVNRCLSRSQEAWTEFYQQHHALIHSVVKRHSPSSSRDVREDLAQEVYQSLVVALEKYDGRLSSLRTFVSMVAARTCIDWLRGGSRMSRKGINEPVDHHGDSEQEGIVLPSNLEPADEQVAKVEFANLVKKALSRLSEGCQELLKLRFFTDLTHEEIANRLGKRANSVNVQVLRCIAHLRAAYVQIEGTRQIA